MRRITTFEIRRPHPWSMKTRKALRISGLYVGYIARQTQKASFAEGAEEKGEKAVLQN